VLAATALLGVLLTSVLLAQGRIKRQDAVTRQRAQAIEALDTLLLTWWSQNPAGIPLNTSGPIDKQNNWHWQTREVFKQLPEPLQARLVRVSIFNNSHRHADNTDNTLASVELLIPILEAETTSVDSVSGGDRNES